MISYQLKIVVPANKFDEFIESLIHVSNGLRKEEGCLDFSLYRDLQKKDMYSVLGDWKTRPAMEKHFKNNSFSVLIGATMVLGRDFEMSIGETLEKGSYPLVRKKIGPQSQE